MDKNMTRWFAGGLAVVVIIVAAYLIWGMQAQAPSNVPAANTTSNNAPGNQAPSTPSATSTTYETANLKVTIPAGWTAKEASLPVYEGTSNTPTYVPTPSAVNITKGNYILYVNTQATQASGVEGGRFAEVGMGAPSVDAVVTEEPNECGTTTKTAAFDIYSRVDYYMSAAEKTDWCVAPTNGKTVWFFSYLTSPGNGFFNDYVAGTNPGLVVTMAYAGTTVNALPEKGSAELTAALKEMTDIASTLEVKIK